MQSTQFNSQNAFAGDRANIQRMSLIVMRENAILSGQKGCSSNKDAANGHTEDRED